MADLDRTVLVSGLPTDVEDDRLSDKLLIWFLRDKNGGGEIASVVINKKPPGSALITFEDSCVARRVILHGQHVLKMDDKQYELTLTPHCQRLEPDTVILSMSVTIDSNQLPLTQTARGVLLESYPDIRFRDTAHATQKVYRITGPYSQVQAALAELLRRPGCQKSEETRSMIDHASYGGLDLPADQKSQSPESQLHKPYNGSMYTEQTYSDHSTSDYRSTPSDGHQKSTTGPVWEDVDKTGAMALQLSNDPRMLEEDLSLVMDADMFQYLQKNCGKEYRRILRHNGVKVLDATSDGVTTLFLQCDTNFGEVDSDLKRLKSARSQISQLYQDNEITICRVHLPKITLPSGEVLHRIMENLGVRFPKLLLNEDDQNIYLIGNYSDTSEAKKVLWDYNEPKIESDEIGLLRFMSLDSARPLEGKNPEKSVALPPISGALRDKTDTWPGPDKDESRADGATGKYKLAARFKSTGLGAFESLPDVRYTREGLKLLSAAMQTGSDVLPGTARFPESLSRQTTGEDILFESGVRPSQSSTLGDYERKFAGTPPIQTQISPSGSVTRPALGTGLDLSYERSSSEISIPKVQTPRQSDDTEHIERAKYVQVRGRANSFSHLKGKDMSEICSGKITVSNLIWEYMKEVYHPQLEELTRDMKIEEQRTEDSEQTAVVLTALDSSQVRACQIDIEKLIAKVTTDFSVRILGFKELGVADPATELLAACCDVMRSRFMKVSILTSKESISILGPEHLCSQVASALREVFSDESAQILGQQCLSSEASTLASTSHEAASTNISKDGHSSLFDSNATEHRQENNAISTSEHTDYMQSSDGMNVSLLTKPATAQKETVIKEKVKSAGTTHSRRRSQADTILDSNAKPLDDSEPQAMDTSQDMGTLQKESNTLSRLLQNEDRMYGWSESQQYTEASSPYSNSGRSGQQGFKDKCWHCSSGESVKRLECGRTLCPGCFEQHVDCRLCPKETQATGIQGSISFSEMASSVPGHSKESTIKISYQIPNGIQGEGHPSPGLPFRGGDFRAYLPCTEKSRKLLPRLEKAFKCGFTFTVQEKEKEARVTWDCIPHKTSIHGGKSKNGYPDGNYLTRLSDILNSHGV